MRVCLGNDSLVKQENIVSARNQVERIALTFGVQFSIAFFVPFFRMSGYATAVLGGSMQHEIQCSSNLSLGWEIASEQ